MITATTRIQKPAGRRSGRANDTGEIAEGRSSVAGIGTGAAAASSARYPATSTPQRGHAEPSTGCQPHFGHAPAIAIAAS